eukprot:Pgem_evm1s2621
MQFNKISLSLIFLNYSKVHSKPQPIAINVKPNHPRQFPLTNVVHGDEWKILESFDNKIIKHQDKNRSPPKFLASMQYYFPDQGIEKRVRRSNHGCGGSVISSKHILTAHHCLPSAGLLAPNVTEFAKLKEQFFWGVGGHDLNDNDSFQKYNMVKVTCPKRFSTLPGQAAAPDMCIVEVDREIEGVKPVALNTCGAKELQIQMKRDNKKLTLIGWGMTNKTENDSIPAKLMRTEMPLVAKEVCYKYLDDYKKSEAALAEQQQQEQEYNTTEQQQQEQEYNATEQDPSKDSFDPLHSTICAGYEMGEDSPSACAGDSGGPLYRMHGPDDSQRVLVGDVSWGAEMCENYGFFGDIASEIEWIKTVVPVEELTLVGCETFGE